MPCLVTSFKRPRKDRNIKHREYFCYPIAIFDFDFIQYSHVLYWNCKCLEVRDVCLFNKDILQRIKPDTAITEKTLAYKWLKEKLRGCIYSISRWYNKVDLDYFIGRHEYPEIIKIKEKRKAA